MIGLSCQPLNFKCIFKIQHLYSPPLMITDWYHILHANVLYSPYLLIVDTDCFATFVFLTFLLALCLNNFLPLCIYLYVCLYWWNFHFIIFFFLAVDFSFSPRDSPLTFVVKLVWWCWNFLKNFCLSVKLLISP